jgi:L-iditol 2-dehydrogenase
MAKMKAAVCTEPRHIEIRDVDVPEPGEGEVLVRVKSTGLCGSDVDGYLQRHPMIGYPIILGHECAGVVAKPGPGVTNVREGDEVIVEPFFICGACKDCREGRYSFCTDLKIIGHQVPGSLAEFVVAQAMFCHPKPENLSFEEAAVAEPVTGAFHAVKRCGVGTGDLVAILGCGTIGVMAMQHCLNAGAVVVVSDLSPRKLKTAAELGAQHTVNAGAESLAERVAALSGGRGADVVIEAVGEPETLAATVGMARKGGTIMLIGWSGHDTDPFDITNVTLRELTVMGTMGFCWDHAVTLDLLARGKVRVAPIITHRYPLAKVEEAVKLLASGDPDVWKIAITE